ncbi:HDIG domain-containing metalloprotein [Desulfonatronospira sp.]|uniref:HDIG domain-containing metalloprotein n=1 Tax=Desulfonatronospira sp. TaxID=1962951 RepID=UPI0025C33382|nr:HDIG domain-containing metalloprotein [Desulfonatronospira sp.]
MISVFQPVQYPMDPRWKIPTREECRYYWNLYHLPGHIREHSILVAHVAEYICTLASSRGLPVNTAAVVASALLHDLGKFFCIEHGGSHNQLGASLVMELTGNPAIAQGVMHHVCWPGELDIHKFFLPLVIIYSDKRVMHERIVSLETRFEDIYKRYGVNPKMYRLIHQSWLQTLEIQEQLNRTLEADLNACTFDSRRVVQGKGGFSGRR